MWRASSVPRPFPEQQRYTTTSPREQLTNLEANPRKIDVGEGNQNVNFAKDLVKHDLLTASSELALARQFRVGVQIKAQRAHLENQIGRAPTDAETAESLEISEVEMGMLVQKGADAKTTLVQANMRLVFHIAKYYRFRGVSYPDLVQEGTFGLMKAVDKFDPERGFRFSTYASWWIKQSVSRAIAEKSRIVRLPVHIHDMMVSISRAERQFAVANSRKPTPTELAERLALPVRKVELLVKCARDVNSMDENVYQNKGKAAGSNEVQVKDRIVSETSEPSRLNENNSLRSELRRVMQILSEREAQIVEMRFGLSDGNPMTLEEIGKFFSVTRERIRQIEARALSKMRHPLKATEMREIFLDDAEMGHTLAAALEASNSAIDAKGPSGVAVPKGVALPKERYVSA
jgi:RNA polymerase sigma factor (sigma-70 family)